MNVFEKISIYNNGSESLQTVAPMSTDFPMNEFTENHCHDPYLVARVLIYRSSLLTAIHDFNRERIDLYRKSIVTHEFIRGQSSTSPGYSSPYSGCPFPQLGQAVSDLENSFPKVDQSIYYLGHRVPKVGHSFPELGQPSSYLGHSFPKIGQPSSYLGQSSPEMLSGDSS